LPICLKWQDAKDILLNLFPTEEFYWVYELIQFVLHIFKLDSSAKLSLAHVVSSHAKGGTHQRRV
jgi:hypothetical protein